MNQMTAVSLYSALPSVGVVNDEYLYWHPYWVMVRDCVMGEIAVKRRGQAYLPKLETQSDPEYQAYLQRAVYYNATSRTVNGLVGAVHLRPPLLDNLPDGINLDSVTRDGQSFEAFAKRISRELCSVGRYGVLLDAPSDGQGDAYFAGYVAEDILDWRTHVTYGREQLVRVVLREVRRIGEGGLASELKEVYRVLVLDDAGIYRQRLYEEDPSTSSDYVEVTPMLQGRPLDHIPFHCFGPYDFGFDIEKPPVLDIALLNLSHYRSYAQLEAGRFYTATPVWAVFLDGGADDEVDYKVGPNVVWQLGANDKADLIEFGGAGLRYLENALSQKEAQIAQLGGKLGAPVKGVAAESSDSVAQRERGEQSFLQSMLTTMSLGMTTLLRDLCRWRGQPADDAKVRFASDCLELYMSDREIRAITSLWKTGLMPVEVLYAVFRDANIIPPNMGLDEFKERLPTMTPDTEQKIAVEETRAALQRRTVQAQAQAQADAQIRVARATPKPEPAPVATSQPATEEPAKPKGKTSKPKASTKKAAA